MIGADNAADVAKGLARPTRLRRGKPGLPRVEKANGWYGGWIARGADGYRLAWGDDFVWSTRDVARTVCFEDDLFSGPEERAANGVKFDAQGLAVRAHLAAQENADAQG